MDGLDEQVAGELVEGVLNAVGGPAEGDEVHEYEKNVRRATIERALEEMLFDVVSYCSSRSPRARKLTRSLV